MAWRAVHDSLPYSESLAGVSDFACWLWVNLLVTSDQWGRGFGSPSKVRARCVPLRPVTDGEVLAALEELVRARRLELHIVAGSTYAYIVDFDKHQPRDATRTRVGKSKFPDPPSENPLQMTMPHKIEMEMEKTTAFGGRDDDSAQLVTDSQPSVAAGLSESVELSARAQPDTADAPRLSAQTFVAFYIGRCRERGLARPPERVIGQLSRELKDLVAEGQPAQAIYDGLSLLVRKALGPSQLASCVQQVQLERAGGAVGRRGQVSASEILDQAQESARARR